MTMNEQKENDPCVVDALYHPSFGAFAGNPLIEALPEYLTKGMEIQEVLARTPPLPASELSNRKERSLCLMAAASDLFVAIGRHVAIFEVMDRMIREGYLKRNPLVARNAKYVAESYKRQQTGDGAPQRYGRDKLGLCTVSVIGCSGAGKSYAVEEVLKFYPQVIQHKATDRMDPIMQVVFLKIECPPNGSVKTLCKDIIGELDAATGLHYDKLYRTDRATESDLRKAVAQTLAIHRVGILVIDEIQNLTLSRKNHEELFNFIVSLANSVEVPVLNIGTPKVQKFIEDDMRLSRRFATWGLYDWSAMKSGDYEWHDFFEILKKVYLLEEPMEDDVENSLFYHSQGVPGILVHLFLLSQMRAMVEKNRKLNAEIIQRTDGLYFSHMHPMVKAIRDDDKAALAKYADICLTTKDMTLAAHQLISQINP